MAVNCWDDDGGDIGIGQEDLALAWEAAHSGDVRLLTDYMERFPDHVVFNVQRQSIQLTGCTSLIANIPLDEQVVGLLEAALQQ